jgi:mRNA-degrading endonuclease RelE of RelBE toxin-antitoxin system
MKTEYKPTFIKDLKALRSTPVFSSIKKLVFDEILEIDQVEDIPNVKRLKGADNAYRIRVGDYRIGVYLDGDTLVFARVLHRRAIYRYFP